MGKCETLFFSFICLCVARAAHVLYVVLYTYCDCAICVYIYIYSLCSTCAFHISILSMSRLCVILLCVRCSINCTFRVDARDRVYRG